MRGRSGARCAGGGGSGSREEASVGGGGQGAAGAELGVVRPEELPNRLRNGKEEKHSRRIVGC